MKNNGFSIVEVMLAVALFMIFATGMVGAVLYGLDNNRLSGEQLIANQYAAEGLEAARSIKNQAYTNLVNSTGTGIAQVGNVWTFSGTNNIYDKYTRVITVVDVERDANGNIVASGGALDPNSKKIVSTVSWNFTSARANSVVLTTYLTNWKAVVPTPTPSTCNEYAVSQGYSTGTCRQNKVQCTSNGETYLTAGDMYCTDGPSADTCCALVGPTPTPTVTPTLTPTPTTAPTTCNAYCISLGTYIQGTCRKGASQCNTNGETMENGGNPLCIIQIEGGTCCCK